MTSFDFHATKGRSVPGQRAHHLPRHVVESIVQGVLTSAGYAKSDFDVSLDEESQLSEALGLDDRLLTLRCRFTDVERLYAVGPHLPWVQEIVDDLRSGLFGGARQ